MVATKYVGHLRQVLVLLAISGSIGACAQGSVSPDGGRSADARAAGSSADAGNNAGVDAARVVDARPRLPPADARPSPPDAAPPPPDAMPVAFPMGTTTWMGDYDCVQGKTALVLELTYRAADDTLTGTFSFSEHASNPGTPPGSYSVSGTYAPNSRAIVLQPEAWITQPDGYSMVGLVGEQIPESPPRLMGTVQTGGCAGFDVTLQ